LSEIVLVLWILLLPIGCASLFVSVFVRREETNGLNGLIAGLFNKLFMTFR